MKVIIPSLALALLSWHCSTEQITHFQSDSTYVKDSLIYIHVPGGIDTFYVSQIDSFYQTKDSMVTVYKDKVIVRRDRDSIAYLQREVNRLRTLNDSRIEVEKIPFTQKMGWGAYGAIVMVIFTFGIGFIIKGFMKSSPVGLLGKILK